MFPQLNQCNCDKENSAIEAQLARAGFRIVVTHGHSPSNKAFRSTAPLMKEKYGLTLVPAVFDGAVYGCQNDHASANETSILMPLHPELVDMQELSTDPAALLEAVAGNDPRYHASPEIGQAAPNETVDYLVSTLAVLVQEL